MQKWVCLPTSAFLPRSVSCFAGSVVPRLLWLVCLPLHKYRWTIELTAAALILTSNVASQSDERQDAGRRRSDNVVQCQRSQSNSIHSKVMCALDGTRYEHGLKPNPTHDPGSFPLYRRNVYLHANWNLWVTTVTQCCQTSYSFLC